METYWPDAAASGLRNYVRMVAEAVRAGPKAWCCEAEVPRGAYVALEGRIATYPDRDVALVWDERHGWAVAIETASAENLLVLDYLGGRGSDVLAAPVAVAEFVQRTFAMPPGDSVEPPCLRSAGSADGFDDTLADYVSSVETTSESSGSTAR